MRSKILLTTAMAGLAVLSAPIAGHAGDVMRVDTMHKASTATGGTLAKGETVDARIANLHDELKITSAEEKQWGAVADAMRENDADMKKKLADKQAKGADGFTAKEDLEVYQEFAQAHLDGLKNLREAFDTMYDAMPADQQKNADTVFHAAKKQ